MSFGAIGATLFVLGTNGASAQQAIDPRMPVGPNRELVARVCTGCHDLGNLVATAGRSRAGWDVKIDDMVLYGMKVTPEQRALILEYLATFLPP
jgi:cytochrome c5